MLKLFVFPSMFFFCQHIFLKKQYLCPVLYILQNNTYASYRMYIQYIRNISTNYAKYYKLKSYNGFKSFEMRHNSNHLHSCLFIFAIAGIYV